ncbi:MAG: hypothetical protein AAF198_05105 [Pseudomonadota bacterium]
MSQFVKAAKKLYKDKYPDANFSVERAFEDGNSVFIHAFHDKTSKEATHHTMDVFTFDPSGRYICGHTAKSRFSLVHIKRCSLTQGPKEVTDANKELIKRYFDNFIKRLDHYLT